MTLTYGFVKSKVAAPAKLRSAGHRGEVQYHLHVPRRVDGKVWDVAINVGTNDADDLLTYKLAYDFHHPIIQTLAAAPDGFNNLTGQAALPALDFMRSDILTETGVWRPSDVMDGSEQAEPIASILRPISRAQSQNCDVYVFGRRFANDGAGAHDHNDIWQDGALLVDLGDQSWTAYFAAFQQQRVPTDGLGNPLSASGQITR